MLIDRTRWDVAVIGAGPGGLAAAVAVADAGARVALLDAEPAVGGQFWRHPSDSDEPGAVAEAEVAGLHHGLRSYRRLRSALEQHAAAGRAAHLPRHEVWSVQRIAQRIPSVDDASEPVGALSVGHADVTSTDGDGPPDVLGSPRGGNPASKPPVGPRFAVNALVPNGSHRRSVTVLADALVLATGAYDLQVPFPGWDLPGVMTAGGVQSLLKGHGVLAGRRVVVAGTGPFLLSVASGLASSGASVQGVFEAAGPARWAGELRALPGAWPKLIEGAGYALNLARHRIGYHTRWTVIRADGNGVLDSVTVAPLDRSGRPVTARSRVLAADVLAVGWGFVPQLDLPLALGCGTVLGPDGSPVVLVDSDQHATAPGVFAVGEICGVGGAALAVVEGQIAGGAAAASAAGQANARETDRRLQRLRRRRGSMRAFANALQRVYPVPDCWIGQVEPDTVVCRCEEVTAGVIRAVVERDGVSDARTAKLLVRPGMGWCQGRVCGYATECLVRTWAGQASGDGGGTRMAALAPVERSIAVPIPLGALGN